MGLLTWIKAHPTIRTAIYIVSSAAFSYLTATPALFPAEAAAILVFNTIDNELAPSPSVTASQATSPSPSPPAPLPIPISVNPAHLVSISTDAVPKPINSQGQYLTSTGYKNADGSPVTYAEVNAAGYTGVGAVS